MKKLLLLVLLLGSFAAFSQGTITGTVMDSDQGGPLSGANVVEKGGTAGAITDFDGNFSLQVNSNSGTVSVSYLGYTNQGVSYTLSGGTANLGTISLEADANSLEEVVIIGSGVIDLAGDRRTPVAVSTITAAEIQDRVAGNVELTEALKNTPSTHVSGQTGFGDSQFFLRGFDQTNIAVLLNGQPVNGMEDGRVYWSNWSGIADIASAIQVQRGLGASKLAISSVGGTTNIVMKAADRKKGGYARFLGANDSYAKGTIAYNTGINEKGWAFSVLLDYWQAHRKWAKGTYGQGQNYFFAAGYKPNDTHAFNFLVTGAPQLHGQKWSQSKEIIADDPKYNQHWGSLEGEGVNGSNITSERQNYYHKPVMNLNWDWTMSEKSELSTVAYASWGRGGGTGPRGDRPDRFDSPNDDISRYDGQIDYPTTIANNTAIGVGDNATRDGYIRRASVNNHQWYGIVSNFEHDLTDKLSLNIGVDGRMYTGDHFRQVINLYGLTGWANDRPDNATVTSTFDATPWASLTSFASEDERINYDYSEDISYIGGFGQLEYATDSFSAFFQGAYSSQSYQREDRFAEKTSDKVSRTGYNLKGGLSYRIEEAHTIFANGGYYSRQPYLDNIFAFNGSNADLISPDVENEIIRSFEAGYHYKQGDIKANFNAYVTDWDNRTISNIDRDETDTFDISVLQRGIRQFHTGAEFDLGWRASNWLTVNAYISGGSWTFDGISNEEQYNLDTQELISSKDDIDRSGVKVSTAPQFTTGFRAQAKICKGLSVDGNINYRARHYEYTDSATEAVDYMPRRLDPYSITDLGLSYKFNLGASNDLTFRGNVFNAFDYLGFNGTDRFGYFIENGRTYNASLKYNF